MCFSIDISDFDTSDPSWHSWDALQQVWGLWRKSRSVISNICFQPIEQDCLKKSICMYRSVSSLWRVSRLLKNVPTSGSYSAVYSYRFPLTFLQTTHMYIFFGNWKNEICLSIPSNFRALKTRKEKSWRKTECLIGFSIYVAYTNMVLLSLQTFLSQK